MAHFYRKATTHRRKKQTSGKQHPDKAVNKQQQATTSNNTGSPFSHTPETKSKVTQRPQNEIHP